MGGTGEANFSDCYQREYMNYRKCESYPDGNSLRLFFNYQIGGGGGVGWKSWRDYKVKTDSTK